MQAAAVRPDACSASSAASARIPRTSLHMKRTADRLFGDDYHWSVLGAGRNQMPIAAHGGRDGRQRARRAGGQPVDRPGQARRVERRSRCARCARSSRGSGLGSRRRTRRARSCSSRAATRWGSELLLHCMAEMRFEVTARLGAPWPSGTRLRVPGTATSTSITGPRRSRSGRGSAGCPQRRPNKSRSQLLLLKQIASG